MVGSDRQVRLLGAYGVFTYPFACVPFLFFYFRNHGVDLSGYLWLIAWYYWAMVLMEIPTGIIADRFGRRQALIAGSTLLAAGFVTIGCSTGFAAFCVGEILFGVGHSLLSGAPTALLFDRLKQRGRAEEFLVLESRIHALRLFGTGGSFLLGGLLAYLFGLTTAILATGGLCLVGALVACCLQSDRPATGSTSIPLLRGALGELRSPPLIWILVYFLLLFGLLRFAFHTYQPYFLYSVFDAAAPRSNWLALGTLFAALNFVAAPCSRWAPRLRARFREGALFFWMPTALCVAFVVMAAVPNWIGVLFFFLHQVPFGLHWALVQEFVNRRVATASRATTLSVVSFAGRVTFAAWFPLVAIDDSSVGLARTYYLVGAVGLCATAAWCAPWLGGRLLRRAD